MLTGLGRDIGPRSSNFKRRSFEREGRPHNPAPKPLALKPKPKALNLGPSASVLALSACSSYVQEIILQTMSLLYLGLMLILRTSE